MGRRQLGFHPMRAPTLGPTFPLRLTTYLGVWFVVFGIMQFNTPLSMEGGVNPFLERLGGTLCSPVMGITGLSTFVGGNQASKMICIISLAVMLGAAAFILFRCRTWKGYWVWFMIHCVLVVASAIGFHRFTIYTIQNP